MRILVLVNTLNSINAFIYSNHIAFFVQSNRDFPRENGHEIHLFTPPRMSIDMARNTAAKEALRRECDYLMFVDDDVLIPADAMKQLINLDSDIAAGLVIIRGYPFNVMAFKRVEGKLPYYNDLPKVDVQIAEKTFNVLKDPITQDDDLAAVGFSCALIKTSLLKIVEKPYFITGPRGTEDVYFCIKATETLKRANQTLKIAMSPAIQCGHQLHPEPIEYATIDEFKQHFENLDPKGCESINDPMIEQRRDENYLNRCLNAI